MKDSKGAGWGSLLSNEKLLECYFLLAKLSIEIFVYLFCLYFVFISIWKPIKWAESILINIHFVLNNCGTTRYPVVKRNKT